MIGKILTKNTINKGAAKSLISEAQKEIEKIQSSTVKANEIKQPTIPILPTGIADDLLNTKINKQVKGNIKKPIEETEKIKVSEKQAKNLIDEIYQIKNKEVKELIGKDFNFDKIQTTDDVKKIINLVSDKYSAEINVQKRGVQTQKNIQDEVNVLLNTDQDIFIQNFLKLNPGSTLNAANLKAVRDIMTGGYNKLDELSNKAVTGGADDLLAFRQHYALMAQMHKIFKGVQTETGRALNQFRYITDDVKFTNLSQREINKINLLTELGGAEEIRELAKLYSGSTVKTKIKFNEDSGLVSRFGKTIDASSKAISEIYINSLLSSPITHVKNTAGNYIAQGLVGFERMYAARVFGEMGRPGVAPYEDIAKSFGKSMALQEMFKAFGDDIVESLQKGKLPQGIKSDFGATKLDQKQYAFVGSEFGADGNLGKAIDLLGSALTLGRIPTKTLTFFDNFFKNMEYRSELYALAYRDTLERIAEGTLNAEKASSYLARLVTNPSDELAKNAYDAALYTTFQTKLGTRGDFIDYGKIIIDAKKSAKGVDFIINGIIPFVQTPANILGFTLERSPGLNLLLTKYRKDLFGPDGPAKDIAKAKLQIGLAFYGAVATGGYYGYFSGSDADLKRGASKRQTEQTLNYQPKSIRIPYVDKDGNQQTFQLSINGFDPVANMFANAADLGALARNVKEDGIQDLAAHITAFALYAGENLVDTPFLTQTAQTFKDIEDATSALYRGEGTESKVIKGIANRYVSGFIPAGAKFAGSVYNELTDNDPRFNQQKVTIELDSYLKRNFDETNLYSKYDLFGDPIDKLPFLPLTPTTLKKDPLREELKIVNPRFTPFPKSRQVNTGLFNVSVPYNEKEISMIEKRSGELFKQEVTNLLASDEYINATDEYIRSKFWQDVRSKSVSAAENEVFSDPEIQVRILNEAAIRGNKKALQDNRGQPLNTAPSDIINEFLQQQQ